MTAQKRKISSPQKWAPVFAVHAESWNHIHTNYKNRLSKLYLHILVYVHNTYICLHLHNNNKTINLRLLGNDMKGSRDGPWRIWREEKEKEKSGIILFQFKTYFLKSQM